MGAGVKEKDTEGKEDKMMKEEKMLVNRECESGRVKGRGEKKGSDKERQRKGKRKGRLDRECEKYQKQGEKRTRK